MNHLMLFLFNFLQIALFDFIFSCLFTCFLFWEERHIKYIFILVFNAGRLRKTNEIYLRLIK